MIDPDEVELLERSLAHAVQAGPDVDRALDALGWDELLSAEPRVAVSLLFELQGGANATSSALDRVVLNALGMPTANRGVVLPALGRTDPPGIRRDGHLSLTALGTAGLGSHEAVVVVTRGDDGDVAIEVAAEQLGLQTVQGLDPALGLVEVSAENLQVGDALPVPDWDAAVAMAQVALGHELVGASRTMLTLAREHALERVQFDRPIAMFQAVRHRLAETLVAVETTDAMLEAAWLDPTPVNAAMAKALAGRAGRTAARHCQQVLAGFGFTTEHPLHLHIRRAFVLDEMFGSSRALTRQLGDDLLATRSLPPLLPL